MFNTLALSPSIQLLTEDVIDKIAAGEVIENPASAIKELIENSLDAQAQRIKVEIQGGGYLLFRVGDDGVGMGREDLLICLKRHATSKIRSIEDLFDLSTLGFRGEALAALASISKLSIESGKEGVGAFLLKSEGGNILELLPCARERGTTVEVQSLFYNVPPRKKFQKSAMASSAEIHRMMIKLALSHPQCEFSLLSQEKTLLSLSSDQNLSLELSLEKRVKELLGEAFFSSLSFVHEEEGPIRLFGYLGKPSCAKTNRSGQYLLVNRRVVFCPLISQAIKESYGTCLEEKLHPVFVLFFDIRKDFIDVNVHPQKREIRLREEGFFREIIRRAVAKGLQKTFSFFHPETYSSAISFPRGVDYLRLVAKELPFDEKTPGVIQGARSLEGKGDSLSQEEVSLEGKKFLNEIPIDKKEEALVQGEFSLEENLSSLNLCEVGLVDHFLLLEAKSLKVLPYFQDFPKEAVVVVDLSKAFSRYWFESFSKVWEKEKENIEIQRLLIPLLVEISSEEALLVGLWHEVLIKMGMEVRLIGKTTLAIDALPVFLKAKDFSRFFSMLLEELPLAEEKNFLQEEKMKEIFRKLCKLMQEGKKEYTKEEGKNLFLLLLHCKEPFITPWGSPVITLLSSEDLSAFFL